MEKTVALKSPQEAKSLFGTHDENLRLIEKEFAVTTATRGESLKVQVEGIKFIYLKGEDVVRHDLVLDIIRAYENAK